MLMSAVSSRNHVTKDQHKSKHLETTHLFLIFIPITFMQHFFIIHLPIYELYFVFKKL